MCDININADLLVAITCLIALVCNDASMCSESYLRSRLHDPLQLLLGNSFPDSNCSIEDSINTFVSIGAAFIRDSPIGEATKKMHTTLVVDVMHLVLSYTVFV
jgi:hypothetical protein